MTEIFEDLKTGLSDVAAFLSGETDGYKVTLPVKGKLDIVEDVDGSAERSDASG